MKKLILLILCLLLAGCHTDPHTPSSLPQEQTSAPFLDEANAESLQYIPNPHVESMVCPALRLYENSLLLYEHTPAGMLQMKRISLEDGSLIAEAAYPMDPSVQVQVGNGAIGLCDGSSRQVQILNASLETEKSYTVPLEGENWYLNQELETVYVFFRDGLMSYDLTTDRAHWLLDNATFVQPFETGNGYILFSYTDLTDQKTYNRCLNLSTGNIETMPMEGLISSGVRNGNQWLLRRLPNSYILVNQDNAVTFTLHEGLAELLSGRRQLLVTDGSYRELNLYDMEGNFLSRCILPNAEHASVGTDLVWSGYRQGYFFRDTYDNTAHLMFWRPDTAQEGEDLAVTPFGDVQTPEPVLEKELYQKAQDLSQRFELDIRIGEQCALDYSHYQADALTDPYFVRDALDILELAFHTYPDGFLRQLPFGALQQIRIELVTNIRGQDNMDTHPIAVDGFAQDAFDHYLIVFDGLTLDTQTVYHEFSHVIDKHLEWDATLRPQALFSEETWLSLQPEGFRFAYSYTDMPDAIAKYETSGYFISAYAMTFPTEDRATLMAQIISDKTLLQDNPGMAEKMRYYAACIRDCFQTDGWPKTTAWELSP